MAKNASTKGAPSKVTNTRRQDRRTAKRETSLRERASKADKLVTQLTKDGADEAVIKAAQVKADKLNRMYNAHKSAKTRHSGRPNVTRVNTPKALRRVEGGAFGNGRDTWNVDPQDRHKMRGQRRHQTRLVKLDEGVYELRYNGTQNVCAHDDSFRLMEAA